MAVPAEADTVLLPAGLKALKRVARQTGLRLTGSYFNLDGGFDSKHNRKVIFNAGMIPNIPENPRNRKTTKRGRKRLFNATIHTLRDRVEQTFAWKDKFKRLRRSPASQNATITNMGGSGRAICSCFLLRLKVGAA